jgi:hypothetical protein
MREILSERELAVGPSEHIHGARLPNAAGQFYIQIPLLKRFIAILMMEAEDGVFWGYRLRTNEPGFTPAGPGRRY